MSQSRRRSRKDKRGEEEKPQPCSFCTTRPRERNDLCNRCRQKVEARANKLLEQKILGDMQCISTAVASAVDALPVGNLDEEQLRACLKKIVPLYTLRHQADTQYKGKKGNTCWCLPDRILREAVRYLIPGKDTEEIGHTDRCGLTTCLMNEIDHTLAEYPGNNPSPRGSFPSSAPSGIPPPPLTQSSTTGLRGPSTSFPPNQTNPTQNTFVIPQGLPPMAQIPVQYLSYPNQSNVTIHPLTSTFNHKGQMIQNIRNGTVTYQPLPVNLTPQFQPLTVPPNQQRPLLVSSTQPFHSQDNTHRLNETNLANLFDLCGTKEQKTMEACLNSFRNRGLFSSVDAIIQNDRNLLHTAALHGAHRIVGMLVTKFGAKVHGTTSDANGWTPLHFAAGHGHALCVETLLKLGAHPNIHGTDNQTPLHLAVQHRHLACAEMLVRHPETNVNEPGGRFNDTALHLAARLACETKFVPTLIAAGASFTVKNSMGNTPFHEVLLSQQNDAVMKESKIIAMFTNLKDKPCDFESKNLQGISVVNASKQLSADTAKVFQTFLNSYRSRVGRRSVPPDHEMEFLQPSALSLPPLPLSSPPPLKTKEEKYEQPVGYRKRRSEDPNENAPPSKRQRIAEANVSPSQSVTPPQFTANSFLQPMTIPNYLLRPMPRQQVAQPTTTLSFLSSGSVEASNDRAE